MVKEYNDETGLLANLDRAQKRKRNFYDIAPKGRAMYDEADKKLNHYKGLIETAHRKLRNSRTISETL